MAKGVEAYGAIEHVVVALLRHRELDVCGVAGGDVRLRHQERRAYRSVKKRSKPFFLLRFVAVLGYDLHVPSVWSCTVDCFRSTPRLAQVLSHKAVFHIGEAGPFFEMVLRQEHVPQPQLLRLMLQLVDDLRVGLPSLLAFAELCEVDLVGGNALFFDKLLNLWKR